MNEKYSIGKVNISRTTPEKAVAEIKKAVECRRNNYICVSNVRTVAYANRHKEYCNLMNSAYMCMPDGMPLVWMARLWGLKDVRRTTGPDIFTAMLSDRQSGIKHFLLGDTEEVLMQIKNKYSHNAENIVGTYSPPFCELDEFDYESIAKMVNESNADVVWIALRAPKQDFFAVKLLSHLDNKICIGVGAAFRFSLGQIKHPPKIFRKLGLTGLFWRRMSVKQLYWYIQHLLIIIYFSFDIIMLRLLKKQK